jgi:Tol biopolymer transport system component
MTRYVRSSVVILVAALAATTPASAQYFGRNKVHYKKLDFEVLKTERFDIYFYPSARPGIDIAARMAERWMTRLEQLLGHQLRGRQPLVLYGSHPDFEQTNVIGGELGEGTGGVTEALRRRIVLPLAGPLADTDHVIGHELVHAFQYDITTRPGAGPGETGANALPLWFIEGMAEYLSIGPVDPHTAMWLRDAVRQDLAAADRRENDRNGDAGDTPTTLPSITELDDPKYFPYRWGQAFWAYVAGRWGDDVVGQMLRVGGATGDPRIAIQKVLGVSDKELSSDWHTALRRTYEPILRASAPPSEVGRLVIKGAELGGDLNVGPAISPDGQWIAFLSERSLFSIDLFLAEASTGRVRRKLTSTATDPHFSSLQFIHSAGAWDADSRRIAIATVVGGRPALAIFDAQTGDKAREVRIDGVDEIFNPTWSPDGRMVAFTGMKAGLTDLYVVDLDTSAVRALTDDPFADMQPVWSPDGQRIAFATDRFSSRLNVLDIGDYRLAVLDPATGRVEQVSAFTSGKNINPQWAPDSRSLYFVSDRDGISNLYRLALGSGEVAQITSVATGLSGITRTSPSLSVAAKTGVAAVTVYDAGNYHIYTIDPNRQPVPMRDVSLNAAALPPADRQPSQVVALLSDPTAGLPPVQEYTVEDYRPRLELTAVGQPTIAVGADRFGPAIGGGAALYFTDMLGDQTLVTAVQVGSGLNRSFSVKDIAAQVGYFNQARRVNWGIVGGQVPYLTGGFQEGITNIDGQNLFIEQAILFRQTERSVAGVVAYPFSRAHRIEFQAGVTQMSFDQIIETRAFTLNGNLIFEESEEIALRDPLSLGTSSAALVYDTASFGATSPVQGQRYRLEAAPSFGGINFTTVLADYRRYFMPVSFYTIAGRVMHYGRYGTGGEDDRLFPLYIGYPSLVRGYDVNSFGASDCLPTALSSCPAFDQLVGTRMLIGNLEFRFPLLRPFGASQGMYGPLPIEVALFADGGVAWARGERPEIFGGERRGVGSAGVAFRMNLFGFAVGEFDFARPFQRPGRGWIFQFSLTPGF